MRSQWEGEIEAALKCPLIQLPEGEEPKDPVTVAKDLLNWAILEASQHRLVCIATLRGKFEFLWNKAAGPARDKAYYTGIRVGNTAARRIYLLLQEYQVIRANSFYSLDLAGRTVHGWYSVLSVRSRRSRYRGVPCILIESGIMPACALQPSVVEMFRCLHFLTTTTHPAVHLLNVPLVRGQVMKRKSIDLSLVRRYLVSILETNATADYPVRGGHCKTCAHKACRKVFSD